jgi:hypothetical protein
MTYEDLAAELEKDPFVELRLHLVSGNSVDISQPGDAWMLRNAVMILHGIDRDPEQIGRYDVVALYNIERIEQLTGMGIGEQGTV